jgi:hypothetical protein
VKVFVGGAVKAARTPQAGSLRAKTTHAQERRPIAHDPEK